MVALLSSLSDSSKDWLGWEEDTYGYL